jgi:histidine triad (HIT) family protein
MASIFTKIVAGDIPSYKIAEDDSFYAFLDINPLREGHTLVIPKREEDYFFNLEDYEISGMMVFAKRVARAIEQVVECNRIGIAVIGLEVAHAHLHLVPIDGIYDIDFSKPKLKLTQTEFESIAEKIRTHFI